MRHASLLAMAIAALALAAPDRVPADSANLPYPVDLRVAGDEGAWQADPRFWLEWSPPAAGGPPVAAVGYRLRGPAGTVLRESRRGGDRPQLELQVPPPSGAYTVDVWMEGLGGERSPTASAVLRYDPARPGVPKALAPDGWVGAGVAARIEILPPPGPAPVSGISGYAVSIDRGGESWPCATRDRCDDAQLKLRGDTEGGLLSVGVLPEGISVVRVVAVSGARVPSPEPGTALVRVDATRPEVRLAGVPGGWVDGPVRVAATATDAISGMAADGPNGPFTALALDGGVPRVELGDSAVLTVSGEGLHRVDAYARDAAGNVDSGQPRTARVAIDETPPQVTFASHQDPSAPERIEATVADALSGADPARGSIGVREAGTAQPWRALRTTAAGGRLIAHWDSDSHPDGIYEFRAIGYDLAGNLAATNRRRNHTMMVLVNPLKNQVRVQAGLARGMRLTRRVPYGRMVVYRGQLTSERGAPLPGRPVEIVENFDPGAVAEDRTSKVLTASDGSFSIRLPRGPSRQVEARFAGTRTYSSAAGDRARLQVRSAVRMRASARTARVGGAPVRFSGRVRCLGARLPRGGLPVELQFRVPGGEWAEFRTVQTDARGRFRYAYAFSDDDSRGVRFQFRAYIDGGDWPYEPAASKAVSVTGR